MACTYWLQLILPSFGWYVIPARHLPQKNLSGNPRVGFSFSPPSNHTLSYLWLMTHHSCIGWVQVGSAWALRVPHFRVRQKLVRYSCVCHGLEVHLCILPLILDLLWRELFSNFPFFIGLLLSRVGPCLIMGFPLFSPFFTPSVILLPFLPYHPAIPTVVLFGLCLLASFGPAACSSLNDSIWSLDLYSYYFGLSWPITLLVGSFVPFLSSWASLAHLLSLGILGPFSNFAFPWAFTNSFRLPWSNYRILYPWGSCAFHKPLTFLFHYLGPTVAHFYFSTSHNAHGFTTSFFGLFLAHLLSLRPTYLL